MDQRTAQAQFLFHAAGQLAGRARQEGGQAGAAGQFVNATATLGGIVAEQATEELQVLLHRQGCIQVLAKALRHVSNMRADALAMARAGHVTAQSLNSSLLHRTGAGQQREQAGLADGVRADQADHAPGRDVQRDAVQRHGFAVVQTDAGQTGDRGWMG